VPISGEILTSKSPLGSQYQVPISGEILTSKSPLGSQYHGRKHSSPLSCATDVYGSSDGGTRGWTI